MQTYLTALEPYLIQQDGYKISVKQIENGVVTTTEVDYKKLDVSKVPELNQKNEFFNIFNFDSSKYVFYKSLDLFVFPNYLL